MVGTLGRDIMCKIIKNEQLSSDLLGARECRNVPRRSTGLPSSRPLRSKCERISEFTRVIMSKAQNRPEQIRIRSLVGHLLRFFTTVEPREIPFATPAILGLDKLPPSIVDLIEPDTEVSRARGGDCGLGRTYFGILIFHAHIISHPAEDCNIYFTQI